jgi:hypothetical protein
MNASKIDVATRRALVKPVTEFAKANAISVGLVMSAILWAGEKQPDQIANLVNSGTVASYKAELARREAARNQQVVGMVANAIPASVRTEENVQAVAAKVFAAIQAARKLSIPALKAVISTEVAALSTPAAHSQN